TAGGVPRRLALVVLTLGDAPGPVVLPGPVRPAHVGEQHLQPGPGPPEQDDARAARRHHARAGSPAAGPKCSGWPISTATAMTSWALANACAPTRRMMAASTS